MQWIDPIFELIWKFWALAFVLLGTGTLLLCITPQPVERIRLIQMSLASVFVIAVAGYLSWTPALELAWLPTPAPSHEEPAATELEAKESLPPASAVVVDPPNTNEAQVASESRPQTPIYEATSIADEAAVPSQPVAAAPSNSELAKMVFVIIVGAATLVQAVFLLLAWWFTHRLVATATNMPVPAGASFEAMRSKLQQRQVRLAFSNRVAVPIAAGILRPAIVLPASLARDDADPIKLRHSLAHEWKHIEHRDLVAWHAASWCQLLFWAQPAYWILRRELRISQDQIADQYATKQQNEHVEYAATLLEFSQARQVAIPGALTMAGHKSNLYRRVEMLLNRKFTVAGQSRKRLLLACVALINGVWFRNDLFPADSRQDTVSGCGRQAGDQGCRQTHGIRRTFRSSGRCLE